MGKRRGGRHRLEDPSTTVFWRWWAAGTINSMGSGIGAVALPLLALNVLHASALEMGMIAAAAFAAWIVIGLPAGVIVQRVPLRGAQVAADLTRGLAIMSIPVAWWWGRLTITHLVITALISSFATVIFDVANSTFLPSIVSPEELQSRNSLTSGTQATTQLSGPPLGGLIAQTFGAIPTIIVDAVSFGVSALLLRTLPARQVEAPDEWPPVRAMIKEGWAFVVRHPVIGPCTWTATAVNFVCGAQITLFPFYLVRVIDAPAGWVGVLLATEGVGSLFGAILATRIVKRVGSARACVLGGFVATAAAFLIPWGNGLLAYAAFGAGSIVFSGSVVILSVTTRTYRQIASPPELLSRVMATVRFVSWGAIPVGGLVAGALADAIGGRAALLIFAAATVLTPLTLILSPVRHLRDFTDYDAAPAAPALTPVAVA